MKLNNVTIFLVLIFALVALSTSSKLNRYAKKKDEGSGSYREGFTCPLLEIKSRMSGKDKKDFIEKIQLKDVKFYPEQLEKKADDYKHGFLFEITQDQNVDVHFLKKVAVQVIEKDKYYIPYRFFNIDLDWRNSGKFDFKNIEGTLVNDDNEYFSFTLRLPYKTVEMYYTPEQALKICQNIKNFANSQKQQIATVRESLHIEMVNLKLESKQLFNAKNSKEFYLEEEKNKLSDIDNYRSKFEDINGQIKDIEKNIHRINLELINLHSNKGALQSRLTEFETILNNIQEEGRKNNSKAKSQEEIINEKEAKVKTIKEKIEIYAKELKKVTPDKTQIINAIRSKAKTDKIPIEFEEEQYNNINKIRSN